MAVGRSIEECAMRIFQHVENPLRVFSGPDSLKNIERELARLGALRAVIFCGNTLAQGPLVNLVREGIGTRCAGVYAGVKAHTPRHGVEEAADELRRLNADAIVAVGGGSAVVTARAAAIYFAEGYDLDAMCSSRDAGGRMHSPRLNALKIPQLIVPTTPNTAMVKAGSAVFDPEAGQRKALFDPKTRSQSIFLHPDLLMSAPVDLVVSSSFDTLALAIEGLLSKTGDAMSDAALMHSIRLLADLLPLIAGDGGAELRADLTMAAILCGRGTDHTGAGAATVLGHAIGANHHVENVIAKTVILQHVLRYNAGHAAEGMAKLARALGLPPMAEPIEAINDILGEVFRLLGTPKRIRDLGIPRDALPAIAERGMADWFLQANPRPVTEAKQLVDIMAAAW
jgi:alcohol dehydrogenase class IV